MDVNGYIIRQKREKEKLNKDAFGTICSPTDLEVIEETNEGILEVILDLCTTLEIPYQQAFPESILLVEDSLLDIVRGLHLRQQ
ncbi:MAG: hypothetical protein ACTIOL_04895 [Enterococcus sp.]